MTSKILFFVLLAGVKSEGETFFERVQPFETRKAEGAIEAKVTVQTSEKLKYTLIQSLFKKSLLV